MRADSIRVTRADVVSRSRVPIESRAHACRSRVALTRADRESRSRVPTESRAHALRRTSSSATRARLAGVCFIGDHSGYRRPMARCAIHAEAHTPTAPRPTTPIASGFVSIPIANPSVVAPAGGCAKPVVCMKKHVAPSATVGAPIFSSHSGSSANHGFAWPSAVSASQPIAAPTTCEQIALRGAAGGMCGTQRTMNVDAPSEGKRNGWPDFHVRAAIQAHVAPVSTTWNNTPRRESWGGFTERRGGGRPKPIPADADGEPPTSPIASACDRARARMRTRRLRRAVGPSAASSAPIRAAFAQDPWSSR